MLPNGGRHDSRPKHSPLEIHVSLAVVATNAMPEGIQNSERDGNFNHEPRTNSRHIFGHYP